MTIDRIAIALGCAFAGTLVWGWTTPLAEATMVGNIKLTEVSWAGFGRLFAILVPALIGAVFGAGGRGKNFALVCAGIAAGMFFSVLYAGYDWYNETLTQLNAMGVDTGPDGNFKIKWRVGTAALAIAALIILVMLCRLLYTLDRRQRPNQTT